MSPQEQLAKLSPEARSAALACLDDISRPIEVREFDMALAKEGVSRSQRRPMIRALLARFDVIALVPKE